MKPHLLQSRVDMYVIVVGSILILGISALAPSAIMLADLAAAVLGAWLYLGYSYRSITHTPYLAQYARFRARIAGIVGGICVVSVCWMTWGWWAGVALVLPRIAPMSLVVIYSLLRAHERRDVREAFRAITDRNTADGL